jgi:GDP-D-mannose dehydratase
MKKALITGITGQEGSYLTELLLHKGYEVVIEVAPKYFRPAEVDLLLGDSSKARQKMMWQPRTDFDNLGCHDGVC